ncbi:phospho-N-acetylmuramoyl-pentapeptide-transferase, partial [Candidatus Parcubacteria bacterium]|nr:phospho-N-acetylmuramoyl-pentapeptide-transferase [Candidatus Parcubacteria bacterium]
EGTPTMGGILVWGVAFLLAVVFGLADLVWPGGAFAKLNFLSRSQTLLPLGALVLSALIGLGDDLLGIFRIGPKGGGLTMKHRLVVYTIVAAIVAWWFYAKLGRHLLYVPFVGNFDLDGWFIAFAVFIVVATAFSTNEADGLDGLAGGVMLIAYGALGAFAFRAGLYDLAAFSGVLIGGLLAFLWYNIHPARFFLGDTGAMSLGVTLGVIALLTNTALLLPLIFFIPFLESASVIAQVISKKFFGRKIFLSTPIHHHFEALGWPETKVTMRFWIVAGVMAVVGVIVVLVGK